MKQRYFPINRLNQLRYEKGYTLEDIERKTGIKRCTYNNYENGITKPKRATWEKLADFFNVSVPYLKGYMVCTRCKGYFIPEDDAVRENIECCPYCMNPYFEGDK